MANPIAVFVWGGRPCVQAGQQKKRMPRWGKAAPGEGPRFFTEVTIRFLDGRVPMAEKTTAGKWKAAKPIRGVQADLWRRVDHLITVDKMEPSRARNQATAEAGKGMI
jgi:hypothetical protein